MMKPPRVSTRERNRLATRELLLTAAVEEIATHGVIDAQVGRIAERAGVTRPTLYAHFPRKEDFLLALSERSRRAMGRRLEAEFESSLGLDLVHAMIDIIFDGVERDQQPSLRREIFSFFIREPQKVDWATDPFYGLLVDRIEESRAAGEIVCDRTPVELVRILTHAVLGFVIHESETAEVRRQGAHDAVSLILQGVSETTAQ